MAAAGLSLLVVGCGSQPNPPQRPNPADLPAAQANLDFSGALIGHVSEVRISQCGSKKAGTQADFYGEIYFRLSGTWYSLEMVTINPLPPSANEGYSGPGSYSANALLRDLVVLPSATLHGAHAWGANPDYLTTLQVNSQPTSLRVGSLQGDLMHRTASNQIVLWPMRSDQSGPASYPRPDDSAMVNIVGSWSCSAS
jgi:hypothetical protein